MAGPAARQPQTVFQHQLQGGSITYHAVWNCVLFNDSPGSAVREEAPTDLRASLLAVACKHRFWAVLLSQGGHFAGAIFELNPLQQQGKEWAVAVRHKTFHRCDLQSCTARWYRLMLLHPHHEKQACNAHVAASVPDLVLRLYMIPRLCAHLHTV